MKEKGGRDHLVPLSYAQGGEGGVEAGGAVADGHSVIGADVPANLSSNRATVSPWARIPLSRTALISSSSSLERIGFATGIIRSTSNFQSNSLNEKK